MTTPAGLSDARDLVAEQMLDKRLWFHTGTLSEVYLQQALRALHAAVVRAGQAAASVPREPLFSLTLTPEEIFGLVEFSGADEADGTEITIEYRYQHEGGPGWYAHLSEYPEEGSIPVHLPYDDHNADAAPAVAQEAAKDQIGGQGHEAAARCPLEGIASSEATCLNAGPSGRIGTDTQQGKLDADAGSTPAPPTTSPDPAVAQGEKE